jgi:hypothetical protein
MKKLLISIIILVTAGIANAQSVYQPYSYQFYQKLNPDVYSTKTRFHSSIKPFFIDDSLLRFHYDSLMNYGNADSNKSLLYRKLFNEHLIDVKKTNSTFYTDLLPNFDLGYDFSNQKNTYLNSIGLQVGGTVGSKFYYYVSGYFNRAAVLPYISSYIRQVGIVPGQAYAGVYTNYIRNYDWRYISAVASYTPIKYLNLSAGRDKTFIGDGYRSLLLSDYASSYPFFKLTANLGNVKYMVMWANFADPPLTSDRQNRRRKWGIFHYLDWNVSNRFSLGLFDAVIWANTDDNDHLRGFDFSYINPVIFLRPIEAANGSPDNALIGLTSKYKLTDNITAYGQFALDEFTAKQFFSNAGYLHNKFAYQIGLRGSNLFGLKGLNYIFESNNARPYTYSERSSILNYSGNSEPLAHPWGANFREALAILNYSYKRFDLTGEIDYGSYGLDRVNINYGKDIFQSYLQPAHLNGNYIGQGIATKMLYMEWKVAYLLNPKYNLRFEIGGIYRKETNDFRLNSYTGLVTIGLRSSFRNLYTDLVSYKTYR